MRIPNSPTTLAQRKASLGLIAIASLALFLPSGQAAVIVSDDFSTVTNVNPLVNGTNIDGRVTPVGGVTWVSNYGVSSSIYNGGVTSDSNNSGYGIFTVPFSVGTYTSFSMTASVLPQFNNLNLCFTTDSSAPQGSSAMTIWAAINGGGGWAVYNGATGLTGGGGLDVSAYHDAVLAYDVTTSTLTFTFNGTQIYSGVTNLSGGTGGLAGITRAGFSYNNITTNTTSPEFASFSVAAVPEPQTWTLGALGASVILFRLRRKARVA